MNIYVGSLSIDVTEADLRQGFGAFGQVASATVNKDKFSGKSRGFAFVEMHVEAEAHAAIQGLNGKEMKGCTLRVNEAHPRAEGRRDGTKGRSGRRP